MNGSDATRESYDAIAEAYTSRYVDELQHKPLDRALLTAFVDELREAGDLSASLVADVGCGPGHVARFLSSLGAGVCGVDLSPAMCAIARELNPGATFYEASMYALPVADGAWDGIVAFYALCHVAHRDLGRVLNEFHRVVKDGGPLLIAYHGGDEVRHTDELMGATVDLDFHFHAAPTLRLLLDEAGFDVDAVLERRAYEPFEVATTRVYMQARKRSTDGKSR